MRKLTTKERLKAQTHEYTQHLLKEKQELMLSFGPLVDETLRLQVEYILELESENEILRQALEKTKTAMEDK